MTESNVKAPEGMHTITPHIVVSDATADWSPLSVGGTATVLHLSTNDMRDVESSRRDGRSVQCPGSQAA